MKGDLGYNSATDKLELYNGAADPVVTEGDTATLSNKTLVAPTVTGTMSAATATFSAKAGVGSLDTNTLFNIGGGSNPLTSATQTGCFASFTGTSNATTALVGFETGITQAGSITTTNAYNFWATGVGKGSGSTLTRATDFFSNGASGHISTNNASFTDNNSYTGNYFLNQAGTDPNVLAGNLTTTGSVTVTPPSGTVGLTINTAGTTTAINSIIINSLANTTGNVIQFQNASSASALIGTGGGNVVTSTTNADIVLRSQAGAIYLAANGNNKTVTVDVNQNFITAGGSATAGYQTSSPVAAATVTGTANTPGLLLTPAGTLATLTIKLPSSPIDGMQWWIATSQTITAVTYQDSGGTAGNVVGGLASLATSGARFVYSSGTSKWYSIA